MLNLSSLSIRHEVEKDSYKSFEHTLNPKLAFNLSLWLLGALGIFLVILFLPWQQNIQAKGALTTLYPSERPQTIESTVAGRIEKWYINEGDIIQKGDTIAYLSEIKDAYFDPELLKRTDEQLQAKSQAISAYEDKAQALGQQIAALRQALQLKQQQLENKVQSAQFKLAGESADLRAAVISDSIAEIQINRWQSLFDKGLESRTSLEKTRKARQEAQAKLISQQNKVAEARVNLATARIELLNISNEYREKIAKAESDRQSALSAQYDATGATSKLRNQLSNYTQRSHFRFIIAPQSGRINKALKSGIGETVKEGEPVVSIVAVKPQLAAEIFIRPVDLPLVRKGQHVRLEFDGWPALIFGSGWPGTNFGTFGGEVYAIENNISKNGLYRILVSQQSDGLEPWPEQLQVGSGTNAFALLEEVPVWYEIWRQLNGFPPEFYKLSEEGTQKKEDKKK
jgi:multidrug efflux pump subunit AcrA (membrane-fusion protein)